MNPIDMQVPPELQQSRDIERAKILLQETQNPQDEPLAGKELGNMPYSTQLSAQSGGNLPSVPWKATKQGNSEDLPSVPWKGGGEAPQSDDFMSNAIGGNLAVGKSLLGIPGYIGGAVNAISGMARGDKPSEALEGMMGAGSDFSDKAFNTFLNVLPSGIADKVRKMAGSVGAEATEKFLGDMFNMGPIGQGFGNITKAITDNPELAKQVDSAVQIAMNMGLMMGNPKLNKGKPTDFTGMNPPKEPNLITTPDVTVNGKYDPMTDMSKDPAELPYIAGAEMGAEPRMGATPEMPPNLDPSGVPPNQMRYQFKGYQDKGQSSVGGAIPYEKTPIEQPHAPDMPYDYQDHIPVEQDGLYSRTAKQDFSSIQLPEEAGRPTQENPAQYDPERYRSPRTSPETIDYPDTSKPGNKYDNQQALEPDVVSSGNPENFSKWVETLPDKVLKDHVVIRQIKQIRSQMDYLNAKLEEARDTGLEGSRIREGDVGRTQKSQQETLKQQRQIQNEQTILDNLGNQLYERMAAKHPDTEPWFPKKEGDAGKINTGDTPISQHPMAKKQGGSVNPEVFREGFRKTKELAEKGISLIARGVGDALKIEVVDKNGVHLGGALFDKKTDLPKDYTGNTPISQHQDLFSRGSGITGSAQHQGLMTEVYKFASEMGNDIVPSKAQSDQGRRMWQGFEQRGISQGNRINRGPGGKQSGAIDLSIFQKEGKLIDSAEGERRLKALGEYAKELTESTNAHPQIKKAVRFFTDNHTGGIFADKNINLHERTQGLLTLVEKMIDSHEVRTGVDLSKPMASVSPINKGPGGKQSGAFDPGSIGEELAKRLNKGKLPKEAAQEYIPAENPKGPASKITAAQFRSWQNRPFDDVWREAKMKGPIEDITDTNKLTYGVWATGKTVAILSEKKNGGGQVIKWINDKVRSIDREAEGLTKKLLGYTYEAGKGMLHPWNKMVKSNDGIFSKWDSHEVSKADIANMHNNALEAMADVREATRKDFGNDKQYEIYKSIRKGLDKALDIVNEARAKVGLPVIQKIPGYLPTMIKGGYRLVGKDKEGNTKYLIGADVATKTNKWIVQGLTAGIVRPTALSEIRAALEKAHPDVDFHQVDMRGTKSSLSDLSAFEETMRALSADDPVAKAIHNTYVQILKSRGFGSHSLQRKGGWTGYEGSEAGYEGAKKMRASIETWMNQAMQYRSNLQKQNALREVLDGAGTKWSTMKDESGNPVPMKTSLIEKELPNTIKYATDYVHHSMGKDLNAWDFIDSHILDWSQALGFGRDLPTQTVNRLGNLASFMWLTRPSFLMVQAVQHGNFLPAAVKQFGIKDTTNSYLKGWKNYFNPDEISKAAVDWATENNYLDAKIINAFDSGYSWDARKNFGSVKDVRDMVSAGTSIAPRFSKMVIGKVEQEMARIPTFLWAEEAMRESIPDKVERFQTAAELTDHYMVNYTKSERPMIYNRLGLGGTFLSKLKQYSHNYYGQFFEYLGDMKRNDPKSFAPMGAFLANNVFQAGLKGMIGMEIATAAVNVINYVGNTNYDTPNDWLFGRGWSDALVFGGVSKITGVGMDMISKLGGYKGGHAYDLSPSTAAPQMPGFVQSPAWEMAKGIGEGVKTGVDMLHGEATPGQKLDAAKGIAPSIATGAIEKSFSPGNGIVPKAKGNDLVTDYTRDAEEEFIRMFIGPRSIDEAKVSAEMAAMNRKMERDTQISNRMTSIMFDKWTHGNKIDQDTLQKYLYSEDGTPRSDPSKLQGEFVDKMKKEMISRANLMIMKSEPNLASAERLMRLKKFGMIMDRSSPEELQQIGRDLK